MRVGGRMGNLVEKLKELVWELLEMEYESSYIRDIVNEAIVEYEDDQDD